ncbi:MAG: DUF5916 domain-containing protein [Candidatus Latescibacterota bacterium]
MNRHSAACMLLLFATVTMLVVIVPGLSCAGEPPFIANIKPLLTAPHCTECAHVDGVLDEELWRTAARARNFAETEPGDQVRPPEETEVLVTWDDTHLYLGFIAYDRRPEQIRASMRARDQIFQDDYVGVIIDTYANAAWAYELYANPYGIPGDRRWTPSGEDLGFDVVFSSQGRITDNGYQVEMAIPFKSLRFPNRDLQDWRVTFIRVHPRDSERRYSWASISRDDPCYPCQFGTLSGIAGVQAGGSFELLPGMVGSQSAELNDRSNPHSGFDYGDPDVDFYLGARYGFSQSTAAEMTINPDFSQVESDVAQVDVNTTFALFFPERRPFFQEGSDLYNSFYNIIYTRQINDPSVAAKFTSRSDRMGFIYLFGRDEQTPLVLPLEERNVFAAPGKSWSNIARMRYTYSEDSFIGAVFTDRRYDIGGSGTVAGVDLSHRFAQNIRIKTQVLVSYTQEPDDSSLTEGMHPPGETFCSDEHTVALDGESFSGQAYYASLAREGRHWNSNMEYRDTAPQFRADAGFVTRNNERQASWSNNYIVYPDNGLCDRIRPNVLVWQRWNHDGVRKGNAIENTIDFVLKGQTLVTLGYDRSEERFRDVEFDGIDLYYGEFNNDYFDAFRFGCWFGFGDRIARTAQPVPFLGTGGVLDVWSTIKIGSRFVIEPLFSWSALDNKDSGEEFFNGFIGRAKCSYQFTRELFLRLVMQYDDFTGELAIEPLLTWQLNPFTVFYVGANIVEQDYGHDSLDPSQRFRDGFEPAAWQMFFKFQYFYQF